MKTLKSIEVIAVDANPILSGLIKGAASRVFWSQLIKEFVTTEYTVEEVKSYIPELAGKANLKEELLFLDLALLPLHIHSKDSYDDYLDRAREIIGKIDRKDVDLLALVLKLNVPLWSNDKDFSTAGVEYFPTAKLRKILDTAT